MSAPETSRENPMSAPETSREGPMSTGETSCERPTSTADETSKSSGASRKRGYVPGEPVNRRDGKRLKRREWSGAFPVIPYDVLDRILTCMLETQVGGLSVIKLSMVNRAFRQGVSENLGIWYRLYLQWRGPIRERATHIQTPRGFVRLRPTVPITVPNFRNKTPPTT